MPIIPDVPNFEFKTTAPTVNDDRGAGFRIGWRWLNTTNDILWVLKDATNGAADWAVIPKDDDPPPAHTHLEADVTDLTHYTHPNHTGDVTSAGDGAQTIVAGAVTNAKAADMAAWTLKLRNNAASGDPQDVKISALTDEPAPAAGDFVMRAGF